MPEAVGHMQIGNQSRSPVKPRHKSLNLSLLLWSPDAYAKNSVEVSGKIQLKLKVFLVLLIYALVCILSVFA